LYVIEMLLDSSMDQTAAASRCRLVGARHQQRL